MDWFTKHADTAAVLGSVLGAVIWINAQFGDVQTQFGVVHAEISKVKEDVAIIKTILIMKGLMPCELAEKGEK